MEEINRNYTILLEKYQNCQREKEGLQKQIKDKENIDINNTTKNRTDYKTNIIQNAQRKNSSHFKQTNIKKMKMT